MSDTPADKPTPPRSPSLESESRSAPQGGVSETTDGQTHKPIDQTQIKKMLEAFITTEKKGLSERFYTSGISDSVAEKAKTVAQRLIQMKCPREAAQYLSTLILYDIAILIDDSLSMLTEQEGKRIEDLKKTLKLVAHIYRLYNDDGIKAVDFLNDEVGEVNVAEEDVDEIFKDHSYRGLTRIGTELQQKVLNESVLATDKEMFKPLLILIFTDGDVEGEKSGHLKWVIKDCIKELNQKYPEHGAHAVAFQFARVGDDAGAEKLLRGLDDDKDIGKYVDTLPVGIDHMSNEERKWPMVYISHWLGLQYVLALKPSKLTKLLLGAIMEYFDDLPSLSQTEARISEIVTSPVIKKPRKKNDRRTQRNPVAATPAATSSS